MRYEAYRESIAETKPLTWQKIKINPKWDNDVRWTCVRLNALGSLFNFEFVVLGYTRLTSFHEKFICLELECEKVRKVLEIPRDHFKTTCATIGGSMWRALPFTEKDEEEMRLFGYGDEWIRWMKVAHNTCTRNLIATETVANAKKWSDKIAWHYESNGIFQKLFKEIIPSGKERKERWTQVSRIHHRLNDGVYQSEGTFDFVGAEVALQSNHYERQWLDDLFGEEASKSEAVANSLIQWYQKLPGCFDTIPGNPDDLGDQLLVNNRWSRRDLGEYIRRTDKTFHFITHSAEGGCCESHPKDTPIFPEEFSMEKLAKIRAIEGDYNYSCHFLNNPTAPGATRFKDSWLRWYKRAKWETGRLTPQNTANYQQLSYGMRRLTMDQLDAQQGSNPRGLVMAMHHEVEDGEVIEDVRAADLDRVMLIDPVHPGEYGRKRHAILVLGIYSMRDREGALQPKRIYFLDAWAKECGHEEWIDKAIGERAHAPGLAWKWKIHRLYGEFGNNVEEEGWHHYFKEKLKLRTGITRFTLHPLKTERSENSKHQSIIGMEAIYKGGAWWMPRYDDSGTEMLTHGEAAEEFMQEFRDYPHGATIDLLDLAGYSPQTFGSESVASKRAVMQSERARAIEKRQHLGSAGY